MPIHTTEAEAAARDHAVENLADAERCFHDSLRRYHAAQHAAAVAELRDLAAWEPEGGWSKSWGPGVYEDPPEPGCPFFTEAFLYELFGKEDARTLLALLGSVARALGLRDLRDLQSG